MGSSAFRRQGTSIQMDCEDPEDEHLRLCGEHFESSCFIKRSGSTRRDIRKGSIPPKFCFITEKEERKPPTV